MTAEQLNHILDMEAAAAMGGAAGAQLTVGSEAAGGASTEAGATVAPATNTTAIVTNSPTLSVNGNNPATWLLNTPWQDNLGTLFTHDGQSETNSTTTVDTTAAGTNTLDYWAVIPQPERRSSLSIALTTSRLFQNP